MQTVLEVIATIFAIIAAWFIYVGVSAGVTVTTEAGEVANLQLMHVQATNIQIGIGAAIVSAILLIGSAIIGAIRRAATESG